MDRNTLIGMLLIGVIFIGFYFFNKPAEVEAETPTVDSTEVVEETQKLEEVNNNQLDSVAFDSTQVFVPAAASGEKLFTLENKLLKVVISSRGGQVVQAQLKKYQTYDSLPLYLINRNADFNIQIQDDKSYNSADLTFEGVQNSPEKVTMTLYAGDGKQLKYVYTIQPDNYMLGWDVVSSGMGGMMPQNSGLQWEMQTLRHEKNLENERTVTQLEYKFANEDDVDDLSGTGEDSEEETNLKWIAYKQQFFSTILYNKNGDFAKAALASKSLDNSEDHTKLLVSKVDMNATAGDLNTSFGLYLGPNKYEVLKAYDQGFEELIPLGWGILGWINRGIVINIFNWLEQYGLNYGLIILIIALIIKVILFPFTYASYRSMAKMRVLKPEIDELNEKYKDQDAMKKQQATMELYQKAGVNPLGGCIPMLFQMPILIALFRFFPASIELRQQPFLWATDLSTYDSIFNLPFNIPFYGDHVSLFTLLMTVSTLIYTYMNQQLTGSNQQMPQLKYMMYLMPLVFLGVFNNYAAGLSYYYFVANMITFGQQWAIRSFIDDEKIHAKIQEKKASPKKENRFMRRMREVQEEQNRQQRRAKK